MNVFELAFFAGILAAGWWAGTAVYPRYGLVGAVLAGFVAIAAVVGGWALVEARMKPRGPR